MMNKNNPAGGLCLKTGYTGYKAFFQAWFVRNRFSKKTGYTTGYTGYTSVTNWLHFSKLIISELVTNWLHFLKLIYLPLCLTVTSVTKKNIRPTRIYSKGGRNVSYIHSG